MGGGSMNKVSRFRFHWLGGKTEVGSGRNVAEAFSSLGYGSGALPALDYFEEVHADVDAAEVE